MFENQDPQKGEVVLYQPNETVRIEVRMENETLWLNRQQMSQLFGRDVKTIGKHVNNALHEELSGFSVVANFATTARDGKIYMVDHYNLDVVLSVGYRVKSAKGVEFRQWANKVLKEYLLKGQAINQRLRQIEERLDNHSQKIAEHSEKIDFFVRTSLPPVEGVFSDGQIFDAYAFACGLIRTAKRRLVLIDNYVDDTVLEMFAKRQQGVDATIYTAKITSALHIDVARHNAQYPPLTIQSCRNFHDRFLLVDDKVYHIGASLKDLGKKLFAFSLLEDFVAEEIVAKVIN